jgi:hypothetical protein
MQRPLVVWVLPFLRRAEIAHAHFSDIGKGLPQRHSDVAGGYFHFGLGLSCYPPS